MIPLQHFLQDIENNKSKTREDAVKFYREHILENEKELRIPNNKNAKKNA